MTQTRSKILVSNGESRQFDMTIPILDVKLTRLDVPNGRTDKMKNGKGLCQDDKKKEIADNTAARKLIQ